MSRPAKTEADQVMAALGRGEPLPSGWAFNPERTPPVYRAEPEPEPEPDDDSED